MKPNTQIEPVDVVVTGVIRDASEFQETFDALYERRRAGQVGRIIYSTWKIVAKNRSDLLSQCQKEGVEVVVATEPTQTMAGNTWMQHKGLLAGLERLGDLSRPVLKTRTDKALTSTLRLLDEYVNRGLEPCPGPLFERKLLCARASVTMPFYFVDFAFIGMGRDMRKLVNFDGYYDVIATPFSITAETRMFSWPFVQYYAFVDEYFRCIQSRNMSNHIVAMDPMELPDYVLAFFAKKFQVIRDHFQLPEHPGPKPQDYPFLGAIWEDAPKGLSHKSDLFKCAHMSIHSNALLNRLADLDFEQDALLERVTGLLADIEDLPPSEGLIHRFSQEALVALDGTASRDKRAVRFDIVTLKPDFGPEQPSGLFEEGPQEPPLGRGWHMKDLGR
ncbi:hypothetical protein HGG73_07495 [Rhodobacteraceae bacterium R_SAG3]|uniref:hypothetical protein n=1 Tax=Tritonibacter mobilis TaxID=379347 RepID=UPI000806DB1D|nr:hypothetical protein [Tritonibacter mobilis]NKX74006.1 hypothetical protein [Rhodobacteraceae bacterium R_SAG3]